MVGREPGADRRYNAGVDHAAFYPVVPPFHLSATVLALFDLDPTLVPHVPVLSVDAHHMGWPLMKVLQARASGSND